MTPVGRMKMRPSDGQMVEDVHDAPDEDGTMPDGAQ